MSSSTLPTNNSCARCHVSEHDLGIKMKQCARCRSVYYCGVGCQTEAWESHRTTCRDRASRVTTRLTWSELSGWRLDGDAIYHPETQSATMPTTDLSRSTDGPDTLYYLETSVPHLYDISISGPYYPLDTIVSQIEFHSATECIEGNHLFISPLSDSGANSQLDTGLNDFRTRYLLNGHVLPFDRVTSAINHDPSKTKTVRLIREHNPNMASRLPCTAYPVRSTVPEQDIMAAWGGHSPTGTTAVRSVTLHGTFDNKASADAHAQIVAERLEAQTPGSRLVHMNSDYGCIGVVSGYGHRVRVHHIVQVSSDTGERRG